MMQGRQTSMREGSSWQRRRTSGLNRAAWAPSNTVRHSTWPEHAATRRGRALPKHWSVGWEGSEESHG